MFTKIVAFSLTLIPFYCWQGWDDGIRTPKEIASVISLAVIIIAGFSLFNIKKAFNKYFFLFFGWCIVTLFLSNYGIPVFIKGGELSLPSNLVAYKSILYIALAIFSIQAIYSSDIDFKFIAKTITIVCLVMCAYCVLQIIGLDEWFRIADPNTGWVGNSIWDKSNPEKWGDMSRRIVGAVGNPSILGIFLSMCIPFFLYLKNKLGRITLIFALVIIGLTLSLTAYICAIATLLFLLFFKNKKIAICIGILLVCLGVYVHQLPKVKFMFNPTGRIEVLKEGFNILNKKAITGLGLGSFEYLVGLNPAVVSRLHNENWRQAHNEFFQVWFETGIIGLCLSCMGIVTLFMAFFKNITKETIYAMASFAVFLLACLTYFPMRISPLSIYGVIILGLLVNKIGEVK